MATGDGSGGSTGPLGITPSQTAGPYLSLGLRPDLGPRAGHAAPAAPAAASGVITIAGQVFDGAGAPVPDALVETWQADPAGRFDHPDDPRGAVPRRPGCLLLCRCPTRADGGWSVTTPRPGPVPGPDGTTQAPHLDVSVFGRGMLDRVVTRIYLPEEADLAGPGGHAGDPVLGSVPKERRHTVIAAAVPGGYRFDIRLQGEGETVFFEL